MFKRINTFKSGQGTFAQIIMRLLNASEVVVVDNLKQRFKSSPREINVLPEEGSAIPRAKGKCFFENLRGVGLVIVVSFTIVVLEFFVVTKLVLKIKGLNNRIKEIDRQAMESEDIVGQSGRPKSLRRRGARGGKITAKFAEVEVLWAVLVFH